MKKYLLKSYINSISGLFLISCFLLFYSKSTLNIFLLLSVLLLFFAVKRVPELSIKIIFIALYLFCFYRVNQFVSLDDINKNPKEIKEVSGFVKDIDKDRVELVLSQVNGKYFDRRVFINLDELTEIEIDEITKLSFISVKNNISTKKYFKNDLIINLDSNSLITTNSNIVSRSTRKISIALNSLLNKHFTSNSGLIKGMVFGIKDDITKDQSKLFKNLGLSHILVASGANIIMIVAVIDFIFKKFKGIHISFLRFGVVCLYISLVGIEGSITRAFFFFVINLVSSGLQRDVDYLQKVILSSLIIALTSPQLFYSISFALSLMATLCLKFSGDICELKKIKNKFLQLLLTNLILTFVISFLTAYLFKSFNLTGLISNVLVLWLVEIIVSFGFGLTIILFLYEYIINFQLAKVFVDIGCKLLDSALELLTNITEKLYYIVNDNFNFKILINFNMLASLYLSMIMVWLYINYKRYLFNIKNFDR